jgi:hypothetical protein
MGRDRMRVLLCAAASIALILAGALVMDWFRLTFTQALPGSGKIAIDLRNMHICHADHGCASTSISPLPGMFPTLATVTLWSSLGLAALVAFQAGARVLTGAANDSFTKLGYVLALTAISLAVATAYMFGPDAEVPVSDLASRMGLALPRTWAPLTLLAGLVAGFATLYMAVSPDSSDLGATYKPVMITPSPESRIRTAALPLHAAASTTTATTTTDAIASAPASSADRARRESSVPLGGSPTAASVPGTGSRPGIAHPGTASRPGIAHPGTASRPGIAHPGTASRPGSSSGIVRPGSNPAIPRPDTGSSPGIVRPGSNPRPGTGSNPAIPHTPTDPVPAVGRTKSGPLPPVPAHLRNRLQYVAITAELTAGGIDARREDGSSRLVLWRDVVGVVARRMPPAYDNATFIDIVSTAGSTLRIVPWTRLTGEPLEREADERPRGVVERVVAMCPGAKVDPATRQFLDTGLAAQLPDLEALHAHDGRLA